MQVRAQAEAFAWYTALCAVLLTLVAPACGAPQRRDPLYWREQILSGTDEARALTSGLAAERAALTKAVIEIIEDVDLQKEQPHVVEAAMILAGEVQLTECIPVLAENILFWAETPSVFVVEGIEVFPAGMALVRIGFASVPTLLHVLQSDDADSAFVARMALGKMPHKPLILDLMVGVRDRTEEPTKRDRLDAYVRIMQTSIKDDQRRGIPQQ